MDKKEFGVFASALRTYYPREQILPNQQAMELWYRELCDIPYDVAEASLRKWVVNNKWSPSIAEIREITTEVTQGELPDWSKGWDETCRLIRKYGSYEPKAAKAEMDELTRETVNRIGWNNLCWSENVTADRANFRMIYEQLAGRKKRESNTPSQLQDMIKGILEKQEQLRLGGKQ